MRSSVLTENWLLKLFSLTASVVLFLFVSVGSATPIDVDYPIEYSNLPDDMLFEGDPPRVIRATLRGPWAAFPSYAKSDLRPIVINLKDAGPGTMRQTIETSRIIAPGGMTVVSARPTEIVLKLDRKVERQVPIQPDIVGRPDFGYEIESVTANPARVRISGPAERMQSFDSLPTREVDIEGRRDDVTIEVDVKAPPGLFVVKDKSVSVSVRIVEEVVTRSFDELPVRIDGAQTGVQIVPERVGVKLKGPRNIVDSLDAKQLEPYVDVQPVVEAGEPQTELTVSLRGNPERTQWIGAAPKVQVVLPKNLQKKSAKRK